MFNTDRMVGEHAQRFYLPAMAKGRQMASQKGKPARELSAWKNTMRAAWPAVQIGWGSDQPAHKRQTTYGEEVEVSARVHLGDIATDDVTVEAYIIERAEDNSNGSPVRVALQPVGTVGDDGWVAYAGTFLPPDTGRYTLTVRASPYRPEMVHPQELGLMRWLSDAGQEAAQRAVKDREERVVSSTNT